MQELSAAARLAAWGGAALAGDVSLDDAAGAVTGSVDAGHRVFGLGSDRTGLNVAYALGRLRSLGACGLRLVLPRPGDATGLPGPPAFNERAMTHGETVLTIGTVAHGLLPEGRGAWTVHEVDADRRTPIGLHDSQRELTRAVREATALLVQLDVSRWEPDGAEVLQRQSNRAGRPLLPRNFPLEAHQILASAMRVLTIVDLAKQSDGAALTAAESNGRARALRDLDAAARRALEAACSTPGR